MKEKHPSAVCLGTVVVSRTVVERLDAVADGAVAGASWFEVSAKPSTGIVADLSRSKIIVSGTFLIAGSFLGVFLFLCTSDGGQFAAPSADRR